jgi:hypothetical protein
MNGFIRNATIKLSEERLIDCIADAYLPPLVGTRKMVLELHRDPLYGTVSVTLTAIETPNYKEKNRETLH